MRFVDLGLAAVIGLTAVGVLVQWSPGPYEDSARASRVEGSLRSQLVGFVDSWGLVKLYQSSPSQICSGIGALSNSTARFAGVVDGTRCLGSPPGGAVVAELNITLPGKEMTFVGWSDGPG